jgi:hypothetical protein
MAMSWFGFGGGEAAETTQAALDIAVERLRNARDADSACGFLDELLVRVCGGEWRARGVWRRLGRGEMPGAARDGRKGRQFGTGLDWGRGGVVAE